MDPPPQVSLAPSTPRSRPVILLWFLRLIRIAALSYLGVCGVLYVIQNRFIFPGASSQGQHDAILYPGKGYDLLSLPMPDGKQIAAIYGTARNPDDSPMTDPHSRPTVIYFYGNGSCMAYSTDVFRDLRRQGANVIIPDYEGYGMSSGYPSEGGCYATADAAYNFLLTRKEIDPTRIIAMGWSMGSGVAIDLTSRRPVVAIITVSAFTSMPAVARQIFPWFPMSLIMKYHFNSLDKIAGISCPILLIHGRSDELVPFWMEGKLAEAAKGRVTIFNVAGAGHNDVFTKGGEALYEQIGSFLEQFIAPAPTPHV